MSIEGRFYAGNKIVNNSRGEPVRRHGVWDSEEYEGPAELDFTDPAVATATARLLTEHAEDFDSYLRQAQRPF